MGEIIKLFKDKKISHTKNSEFKDKVEKIKASLQRIQKLMEVLREHQKKET